MLLALKSTHGDSRHHKKKKKKKENAYPPVVLELGEHLNPTCNSLVWQTVTCMYVCMDQACLPINRWGFPATDIEFPSLITHYRLH